MGLKFDTEDMLDAVLSLMVTGGNLNAKIAAIESEKTAKGKGLSPVLAPIPDDGYYLQTWSDKMLQTSPAIFYGIEDVQVVDGGGVAAKTYKIFVEVVYTDAGQTNDTHKRIARYARALEELFLERFDLVPEAGKVKIDTVRPMSFKLELDSSEEIKVGGVSLTITIY